MAVNSVINTFSHNPIRHPYSTDMGLKVDGKALPDPSSFEGADSALDTSGERDMNGLLHRNMVATKHPLKLEWETVDWGMMNYILPKVRGESFSFTYPDPCSGEMKTIKAYAGDRAWGVKRILVDEETGEKTYVGKLSFSVIEF